MTQTTYKYKKPKEPKKYSTTTPAKMARECERLSSGNPENRIAPRYLMPEGFLINALIDSV